MINIYRILLVLLKFIYKTKACNKKQNVRLGLNNKYYLQNLEYIAPNSNLFVLRNSFYLF